MRAIKFGQIVITLLLSCLQTYVEPKDQYVQPMMMGMQVAIPYDIANIFNRPVSLSPFVSTFFGLSLLYILFFGVITSPFGYMFGVPSQKYVLGIGDDSFVGALVNAASQWEDFNKNNDPTATARSFATPLIRKLIQYKWEYPDFSKAMFHFAPNMISEDSDCQQLILCYAHAGFRALPEASVPLYRVFSKSLTNVTDQHREAILQGLNGANCDEKFEGCPFDIYSLVARTFTDMVPSWLRRNFMLPTFSFADD